MLVHLGTLTGPKFRRYDIKKLLMFEHGQRLVEGLRTSDPKDWPAITVRAKGRRYQLLDGLVRVLVARERNITHLEANVL